MRADGPEEGVCYYVRTIDRVLGRPETEGMLARYSAFVGKRVEVLYRSGDIYLPATGLLAGDSGRSIFLEEHFQQEKRTSTFRWEIPYQYILRVSECSAEEKPAAEWSAVAPEMEQDEPPGTLTLKQKPKEA